MEPRSIVLETFRGSWASDDKDANFKGDVAHYTRVDPMLTLDRMSANLDIPVGSLVRYVLVKWAASGSEALLEMGPLVVRQMNDMVEQAEGQGSDEARLEAYHRLRQVVSWLKVPLEDPGWRPGGHPRSPAAG